MHIVSDSNKYFRNRSTETRTQFKRIKPDATIANRSAHTLATIIIVV